MFKRNQLINRVAKELNIIKILFPISCTKLTVDMLTNFAIGKGAHQATEMVNFFLNLIKILFFKSSL